jgi:IclR family transcriptional regulator, KDG regulon repressor
MRQRLLGSVLHAGAALDLFATEQHEWGTTEIAEALALPKSSAHALLASLTEIGLLERTPDRRFRLGHKLLGFGETVLAGSEVFNAMRDMLNELMQRLGRSVYLAVRDGQHVVYINRMQGPSSVPASLGSAGPTLPMHASAAGKILLAHAPEVQMRRILEGRRLEQLTRRTITNEGALVAELKAVRQRGYALSEGEYVSELYCVAAPIQNRDTEVVAAIGIGATAADFEMNREKMVREVMRAAQLASREQGWRPSRTAWADRRLG